MTEEIPVGKWFTEKSSIGWMLFEQTEFGPLQHGVIFNQPAATIIVDKMNDGYVSPKQKAFARKVCAGAGLTTLGLAIVLMLAGQWPMAVLCSGAAIAVGGALAHAKE